jgi:hypothetical protein
MLPHGSATDNLFNSEYAKQVKTFNFPFSPKHFQADSVPTLSKSTLDLYFHHKVIYFKYPLSHVPQMNGSGLTFDFGDGLIT